MAKEKSNPQDEPTKDPNHKEHKPYDKIFKENIYSLFWAITDRWLGFKIKSWTELKDKIQTTLEREPDFIRIVETEQNEKFILHLEFQTDNEVDMIYRMAEYHSIIQKKYHLSIRHYVIYLGAKKMNMRNTMPKEHLFTSFELINIQQFNHQELLKSSVPEEILIAILGDFKKEQSEEIIRSICERIRDVSVNKTQIHKYQKQLRMLSKLRKLENTTTKIMNTMPIHVEIETDALYIMGQEIERQKQEEIIRNLLKKQEELLEAEKKKQEELLEAEKKKQEELLEAEKKKQEELLEAEKKKQEELLEAEKRLIFTLHKDGTNTPKLAELFNKSKEDILTIIEEIKENKDRP